MQVQELRELAARAKAKCPELSSRVDKAMVLVTTREITPVANMAGQWHVQSECEPTKRYWVNFGAPGPNRLLKKGP